MVVGVSVWCALRFILSINVCLTAFPVMLLGDIMFVCSLWISTFLFSLISFLSHPRSKRLHSIQYTMCNANIIKMYVEQINWDKRDGTDAGGKIPVFSHFIHLLIFRAGSCEWQQKKVFLLCYRGNLSIKMHESLVPTVLRTAVTQTRARARATECAHDYRRIPST